MSGPEPLAALTACAASFGYIGPGAGLEFVTYAMGLLAMAGVALSAVLLWPVYTLLRWIRGRRQPPLTADANQAAPTGGVAPTAARPQGTGVATD
jgi:hypothetical protein